MKRLPSTKKHWKSIPDFPKAHVSLGLSFPKRKSGRSNHPFPKALQIQPDNAEAMATSAPLFSRREKWTKQSPIPNRAETSARQ